MDQETPRFRTAAWKQVRERAQATGPRVCQQFREWAKPSKGIQSLTPVKMIFDNCVGVSSDSGRKNSGRIRIAVAHHYSDLFETRLMRLIRGTGRGRFSSHMQKVDLQRGIWRPLLMVEKAHIAEYARSCVNCAFWMIQPLTPARRFSKLVGPTHGLGGTRPSSILTRMRNLARSLSEMAECNWNWPRREMRRKL